MRPDFHVPHETAAEPPDVLTVYALILGLIVATATAAHVGSATLRMRAAKVWTAEMDSASKSPGSNLANASLVLRC